MHQKLKASHAPIFHQVQIEYTVANSVPWSEMVEHNFQLPNGIFQHSENQAGFSAQ